MNIRKKSRLTINLFSNNEVTIGTETLWPMIIAFICILAAPRLGSIQIAEIIRLIISKLRGF